jgi:hypothetical protein
VIPPLSYYRRAAMVVALETVKRGSMSYRSCWTNVGLWIGALLLCSAQFDPASHFVDDAVAMCGASSRSGTAVEAIQCDRHGDREVNSERRSWCVTAVIEIVDGFVAYYCSGDCPVATGFNPVCDWVIYETTDPPEADCFCTDGSTIFPSPKKCLGRLIDPSAPGGTGNYRTAADFFCTVVSCAANCVPEQSGPYGAEACKCN